MARSNQRVGVAVYLSSQSGCGYTQLIAVHWPGGFCRETPAGDSGQYVLSQQPTDGLNDRGEWIGRLTSKGLTRRPAGESE